MNVVLGPQGEPIEVRDVAVDGPGFTIPAKKATDSSVANGTDRDSVNTEQAVLVGPQGEKIYPVNDSGICPVCQQQWPEACSEDGGQVSDPQEMLRVDMGESDDPDNCPVDDRDNMFEMLRGEKQS